MQDDLDSEEVKIGKVTVVVYNTALYPHSFEESEEKNQSSIRKGWGVAAARA
jgi:hypothetical protein